MRPPSGSPFHILRRPPSLAARNARVHEETECGLPLKDGSVILTVSARWPENTPDTPVTLELEPEGKPTVSATRWSFGPSLNDSYSFSWK